MKKDDEIFIPPLTIEEERYYALVEVHRNGDTKSPRKADLVDDKVICFDNEKKRWVMTEAGFDIVFPNRHKPWKPSSR